RAHGDLVLSRVHRQRLSHCAQRNGFAAAFHLEPCGLSRNDEPQLWQAWLDGAHPVSCDFLERFLPRGSLCLEIQRKSAAVILPSCRNLAVVLVASGNIE